MSPDNVLFNTEHLKGVVVDESEVLHLLQDRAFRSAWERRTIIKSDRDRCVVKIENCQGRPYLLKCMWPRTPRVFMKSLFGFRSLVKAHESLMWLRRNGVSVPRSLGILRWRKPTGEHEVLCHLHEYLAEATTLHEALTARVADGGGSQWNLINSTVEQLVLMHRLKRYHGDMKLNNVLVRGAQIYMIDTHGRGPARISYYQKKDLGRFLVGLLEAGVEHKKVDDARDRYQQLLRIEDRNFMAGVYRMMLKIGWRHAYERGDSERSKSTLNYLNRHE